MPVDTEGGHLKTFQKTGKPIVLIDRKIKGVVCDSVLVDNEQAASDALRLLYEKVIGISGSSAVRRKSPQRRNE